jgi:hypothetical protein
MEETTITALPEATGIDATTDWIAIDRTSLTTTQKINRNTLLGITGSPAGTTDLQTLTNKTLTAPTISSPVLSGTVTGTYTLGGTPTFPSSVVTLTGSQTLTNKTLTSPTINGGAISNSTVSVDAISGFTSGTSGTIYGIGVTSSKISGTAISNSSITATQIADDTITDSKLIYGKIRNRRGGSSTIWTTSGTTTYATDSTNVFVQVGSIAVTSTPFAVTFPTSYSFAPLVFVQVITRSGANTFSPVDTITTTGFNVAVITDGGAGNTAQTVAWMAIGQ